MKTSPAVRNKYVHTGECTRPDLCHGCAVAKANIARGKGLSPAWPKASLEDNNSTVGFYREDEYAPVQFVIPGNPPRFIGRIDINDVEALCEALGFGSAAVHRISQHLR